MTTDRFQARAIRIVIGVAAVFASIGAISDSQWAAFFGGAAIWLILTTPWLRLCWLAIRWARERDYPFVVMSLALLAVLMGGTFVALSAL